MKTLLNPLIISAFIVTMLLGSIAHLMYGNCQSSKWHYIIQRFYMTDNLPKWMLQKSLRGSDSFRPIKIYQDFSGIWYRWYKTGELYSTRHIKMGIDNGRVSGFHENGKKGFEGEYVNGKVNGMFISWDESGLMLYKEVFDFGIKVSSETWPPEAPGFSQKEYFERNGAVSKTEFLMNGKVTRTTQGSVIEDLLKSLEP